MKKFTDEKINELRKKRTGTVVFKQRKIGERIPSQVDVYRDINLGRTIVEVKAQISQGYYIF